MKVALGGSATDLFVGKITALRHSFHHAQDVLTLVANDPLHTLASSRVTKIYEEMTDSDIVSQVLSDAGVDPGEVEPTEESRLYTFQRAESNYSFLRRLAAAATAICSGPGRVWSTSSSPNTPATSPRSSRKA